MTNDINLKECLTSGQVFRFREVKGRWKGVDGENEYDLPAPLSPAFQRLFRLDWDYEVVLPELVRRGPELEPIIASAPGLRLLRPSCPRETLFSFLCTSNNHISRITQMVGALAAYGEFLPQGGNRWPSLERISEVTELELRQQGFGYRSKTIPIVTQTILERGGSNWFEAGARASYPDLIAELLTLPGVGPKLADCIALYAFDRGEAVPIDTHLWQAATRMYFPEWVGTPLTNSKRVHLGDFMRDRFGEYAGLAQQFLFYSSLRRT